MMWWCAWYYMTKLFTDVTGTRDGDATCPAVHEHWKARRNGQQPEKKRNKNEFSEAFRRRSHPKIINLSYVTINIIVQLCLRSTIENILMHAFDYEPIRTIDSKLQSIIHYMVTSCWYHNLHDEWRSLFDYIRVRNIFHHPHPIWPLSKCSIVRHGCGLPNPFRLPADLLHNFADDNRYRHVQKTRRGDEDEKWEQCRQWRQRRQ